MNWTDSNGRRCSTPEHPVRSGGQGEMLRATDGLQAITRPGPGFVATKFLTG